MDIRRFDLNLLVLFDALYRAKNLSAAARTLGLSQPAASAGLRRLREAFEDRLFESTGRGMRPTSRADALAPGIAGVVATVGNSILSAPTFEPSSSERTFTITTSDIGVLIFVPPLLQHLRRVAPETRLRCLTLAHDSIEEELASGRVDLAIGYFPDLSGPDVLSEDLFDHPFTCLVREGHPFIKDRLSVDQFLQADHLVVSQHGRSQEIFERRVAELNLKRRVLLQLPHFMSVPQLIASSDMISIVPKSLGVWYMDLPLKLLDPPVDIPMIELKQHWHRRAEGDPSFAWFREMVTLELRGRDPSQALSAGYGRLPLY